MRLQDPVVAYIAGSNLELQVLSVLFAEAEIPIHVDEDVSSVGGWVGGLIPEIHRPKLWIERQDSERAGQLLAAYEARAAERRNRKSHGEALVLVCDACEEEVEFDASMEGTIQSCPACGEFLDVELADDDEWDDEFSGESDSESEFVDE